MDSSNIDRAMPMRVELMRYWLAMFALAIWATPHIVLANCTNDYLGEACTYEFKAVTATDPKLCSRILGVLNYSFTRFLDLRGFNSKQRGGSGAELPVSVIYPNSDDVDFVQWRYAAIFKEEGNSFALPVVEVDIDNDGELETVIQTVFNGDGRTAEQFQIFRKGEFDSSRITMRQELYSGQGKSGAYPSVLSSGLRARIFKYEGVTYLLNYVADDVGIRRSRAIADQKMKVTKYLGGGRVFKGHETPLRVQDVCVFDMTRQQERE